MKEVEVKNGDIVHIAAISEFSGDTLYEGNAIILWKSPFNDQPLIVWMDELEEKKYEPIWSCYEYIEKVIGHVDIGGILQSAGKWEHKYWEDKNKET